MQAPGAAAFVPRTRSLTTLRRAARGCEGCDLYRAATQTVFGEGAAHARIVLVGEQPGDHEDQEGHVFVGPAGRVLHEALARAKIDEDDLYITNAVKHFRFVERGKRRIHATPRRIEIFACRPWLEAELAVVKPRVVVAMGAVAALALLGSSFRLTQQRGKIVGSPLAPRVIATYHPSAILRAVDGDARREQMRAFVRDLGAAKRAATRK
jgi:uracil-DNA glycosylase